MKKLQVLGTGCAKCKLLEEATRKAATESGIEFELEKVTEIDKIVQFGVMSTPALVIDGEVKLVGKVASVEEIKRLLV